MKATAIAPSNIAFVKYWGRKDEILRLPENGSLSMNLSNLLTTTTVEFSSDLSKDSIQINGDIDVEEGNRVIKHLDRIRSLAHISTKARVVSTNNFPTGTGLSSSASGFAALTVAGSMAANLNLSERELSILARQGSGSACRSIPSGFVEWLDGETSDDSYAVSLYPPTYWNLVDVIAVVSDSKKEVATSEGQKLISSSPFFAVRKQHMKAKLQQAKASLAAKDFVTLGELMEAEALEMHAVMLTSQPSLIYWTPGTLSLMKLVKKWRQEGIPVYFTINTGQDIHLICEQPMVEQIQSKLKQLDYVKQIIVNTAVEGAHSINQHLF